MQQLLQSAFLQSLAYALINSVWQMGLLWLLVVVLIRAFRLSAAQKFNLAFGAQLIGFVVFCTSLAYRFYVTNDFINLNGSGVYNKVNFSSTLHFYTPVISAVYLLIVFLQVMRLFISLLYTNKLRNNNLSKMPVEYRLFLNELIERFSFHQHIKIHLSTAAKCPLTIGFFKPVILMPLAALNHLTSEQMEAVILHEFAHIKRLDYIWNIMQRFISTIFFFNIFSKLLNDIIERERENACDDYVVQFRYNSFNYAEALLKLGRLKAASSFAMALAGKNTFLMSRVLRLMNERPEKTGFNLPAFTIGCVTLFVSMFFFLLPSNSLKKDALKEPNALYVSKNFSVKKMNISTNSVVDIKQETDDAHFSSTKKILANKTKSLTEEPEVVIQNNQVNSKPLTDSITNFSFLNAADNKVVLNEDVYRKVISYQSFKRLEQMMAATGNLISVTEDSASVNSYKKLITIVAADKNGNLNTYKVVVELYQ